MSSLTYFKNPLLRTRLADFDFLNPPIDPIDLIHEMAAIMISHGGIGLAANQLGLPYRVFIIKSNPNIACFNPLIVNYSENKTILDEGCLSLPGINAKVKRSNSIRIRYTQPNGETVTNTWNGLTARICQHEYDHLNGVLFTDHLSNLQLKIAIKKANTKFGNKYVLSDFKHV